MTVSHFEAELQARANERDIAQDDHFITILRNLVADWRLMREALRLGITGVDHAQQILSQLKLNP